MTSADSAVPVSPAARRAASAWTLAWRQAARDFRAGELLLLLVAVMLAVAALSAVGFFADRLNAGLARDARQMLGGDAIVASDQPAPADIAEHARGLGLTLAQTATFPSMGRAPDDKGGASRLVAVKSVTSGYPLRGKLTLADAPGGAQRTVASAPAAGTVWVDAGVLDALQLKVGDALLLGDASLRIASVIVIEPDRGAGFISFAPRVMLNEADLPATGLVQPASRVTYRLAVAAPAGREAALREFVGWTEAQLKARQLRGMRVESLETGRPEMRQTLDRAQKFLNLVALLAALLAAVAVGIAARDFADRHLDDCAMLRVLGQPQRTIALQYLLEFGIVGVLASVAGVLLGFAVHYVFVWLLAGLVDSALPAASAWPALFGIGVGFTLLMGFGLPPVLQLAQVPPLRVIRRDVGALKPASIAVLAAGAIGFAALLLAVSSDLTLGLIAVGGFAGAIAVFALLSWIAVQLLRRAVPESRAPRWLVLATRQIAARPAFAVLQVSALSVGLLALMLLVLLRTDLISSWRAATPADAPNRFVINIQPEQSEAFQARLKAAGVGRYDWFPMIRGRLVAVNGKPTTADDLQEERAKRLLDREFNLSHDATLPQHNTVTAGRWTPDEAGGLSVEEGLAETLHLKLGDTLRFDIAGITAEGKITSLRKVDWGSMRANFFVMFPNAQMPDLPATYLTAFRAPATPGFDNALSREFPNITAVDVSASLSQVQQVLDQVIRAVEFLFGFTLAAGLVVLFAAVTATREARAREFAVMRALGASAKLLGQVQRAELLGVGALAGFLASVAAAAVGWALAKYVFQFSWNPSPWLPLGGSLAGALLALAAGWWGLREVVSRPVIETLRRAAE
ncbi:ABC transporter permease [Rhizobacter sp. OV335]|uniref:ABC transporter permease n=1 Tax=Rhizobacter sp. OV335 TaxID=1500264 RepID=UPI0009181368|nr:FtsX-like permease family protein [Rhizobacter sp. OV335]SHN29627.1 putative ABC transport system permease protein [Rhizobacter sp. OV335]